MHASRRSGFGLGRVDKSLRVVERGSRFFRLRDMRRQSVDLRDVEDRVAAQHTDASLLIILLHQELLGEDDVGGLLAFANAGVKRERLLEGHPGVIGVAAFDGGAPEDRNVDTAIGASRRQIGRQQSEARAMRRLPRLHPYRRAFLQIGDDGVGDLLVERSNFHGTCPPQTRHARLCADDCGGGLRKLYPERGANCTMPDVAVFSIAHKKWPRSEERGQRTYKVRQSTFF